MIGNKSTYVQAHFFFLYLQIYLHINPDWGVCRKTLHFRNL